jgi:hypothetical protein
MTGREAARQRHPSRRQAVPRDVVLGGRALSPAEEAAFHALRLSAAFGDNDVPAAEAESFSDDNGERP